MLSTLRERQFFLIGVAVLGRLNNFRLPDSEGSQNVSSLSVEPSGEFTVVNSDD